MENITIVRTARRLFFNGKGILFIINIKKITLIRNVVIQFYKKRNPQTFVSCYDKEAFGILFLNRLRTFLTIVRFLILVMKRRPSAFLF